MMDRVSQSIQEWQQNNNHQDSQTSAYWFCQRNEGYEVAKGLRFTPDGKIQEIHVPTNGLRRITEFLDVGEGSSSIW